MARQLLIPILDDGEVISSSPLVILDTKYYELQLRITGNPNWTQYINNSPLPLYPTGSPAMNVPAILISPLADATSYDYMIRRFNSNNQPSAWVTGTYTTG